MPSRYWLGVAHHISADLDYTKGSVTIERQFGVKPDGRKLDIKFPEVLNVGMDE